ncbi:MAG: anthranilate synthase component I family protein [Clostridiales bacterium]|nr:anthranilate synthase component I family protein [Clostridiales bacterium]
MAQPDFAQVQQLANDYKAIPVWETMETEGRTPTDVFKILKNLSHQCFILESLEDQTQTGRYTFLGYDPKLEITCVRGEMTIQNGSANRFHTDDPGARVRQILEENKSPRLPELPSFTGGLVGYFAYDYIAYSEPGLNLDADDQENFKDMDLMLFTKVIAFDHLENKIFLIANMKTDAPQENYHRAVNELDHMRRVVRRGTAREIAGEISWDISPEIPPLRLLSAFRSLFNEEQYIAMVQKAKNYIYEGDIFQVVLSNRLEAEAEGSLFDTYRILRETNPSPYMFYFSSDDIEIAGAAPETLVKLTGRKVSTFPLAGTRPRGQTPEEDAALEKELLADPKELAEHNMLVDLGRNDIGKISEFGSVAVENYLQLVRFSHVTHIGSTVTGTIREDKTAMDAIGALLPAGTLSGAPKIRACEIINELENNKRGLYGGAIGYIAFSGDMDSCIAIRVAFKKNGKVFVRSGAGIVADSIPANEFAECGSKARAVLNALQRAATRGGEGSEKR